MIEEIDERFSEEEIEELLKVIASELPSPPESPDAN